MGLPNRDEVEGKWDQVKGKTKETIGRAVDDDELEAEGSAEHAGGKVQEGFGKVKRNVGEAIEDVGDAIKRYRLVHAKTLRTRKGAKKFSLRLWVFLCVFASLREIPTPAVLLTADPWPACPTCVALDNDTRASSLLPQRNAQTFPALLQAYRVVRVSCRSDTDLPDRKDGDR